jgi:hypothetical protein
MINSLGLNIKGSTLLQVRQCLILLLTDVMPTFSPHSAYKSNKSALVL